MPTRNVVLTDHQAALLDRLVKEGRYQNASEAVREGLRRLEEREKAVAEFSAHVDMLLDELANTPPEDLVSAEEVFARLLGETTEAAE